MNSKTVQVMESVFQKNDDAAAELNAYLTGLDVLTTNIMGSPGAGKTSSIMRIIERLDKKSYVIEGDVESDIDTRKLSEAGIPAVQVNTKGACHLDAFMIDEAVRSFNFEPGYLFVENIGNLICPVEFSVGEHLKLVVASTAEGSDKPYKYPLAFEKADAILINKYDLAVTVDFDEEFFMAGVRRINPHSPVFRVSGKTGGGFDEVAAWLMKKTECISKG